MESQKAPRCDVPCHAGGGYHGMPMHCQMRDKFERKDFLEWAKKLYHAEDFQKNRQREDYNRGGQSKRRGGMNSPWNRELQRRLGTSALWYMVSFTGKFDVSFLKQSDDSTQTVAHKQEPTQDLTLQAQRARDRLRWAESLQSKKSKGNRKFTIHEQGLLVDLREGNLHAAANDATRKSGWGRIKHLDGTFEDIAPHSGGIVRTILDNIVTISADDESLDEEELARWK